MVNDGKIMVHCDQCNKTYYDNPDGDGLCPDCKSKERKNAILENGKFRCSCGGHIEKVGDDEYECDDCGQRFERDDWSTGGPDNPSKLKAIQNSAFVYVGDEVKVKDDPGLWIVMDFDGGTYTLKGMGGIKKVKAEQIMRNADRYKDADKLPQHCYTCDLDLKPSEEKSHKDKGHDVGNVYKNADDLNEALKKKFKELQEMHKKEGHPGPFLDCKVCLDSSSGRAIGLKNATTPPDYRTRRERRLGAAEEFRNAQPPAKWDTSPPNEDELRLFHSKNHHGRFLECKICEEIVSGESDMKDIPRGDREFRENASDKFFKCPECNEVDGTDERKMTCPHCNVEMKRISDEEGLRAIRGYSKPSSKKVHG